MLVHHLAISPFGRYLLLLAYCTKSTSALDKVLDSSNTLISFGIKLLMILFVSQNEKFTAKGLEVSYV